MTQPSTQRELKELGFDLDITGHQPGLNLYTQLCLCYAISDPDSYAPIIDILMKGLERLSASFPWVAGQVVNADGIYKIKDLQTIPQLSVNDLRENLSIPTMDAFRKARFPISLLDESVIAPHKTFPGNTQTLTTGSPVFAIQANFITGGLLLCFVSQHQAMDMTGMAQVMDLLSKACHNEQFTNEEILIGNLHRPTIIPLLDDSYTPGHELDRQIAKTSPTESNTPAAVAPPKSSWAYFSFSSASLSALKALATKDLASGFVSTDDTLTALIWQSITRARLPRLSPTTETTMARAIDPRRYLDIPPTYSGLVQNMTYHTYTVQKLVEEPLGSVASNLRSAVDPKTSNLGYATRALVTMMNRSTDKSKVSVTASLDLSSDMMLSSWAKPDSYSLDFNLGLGKPESVRRPQFVPVESLLYLMPKRLDGEISAAICLRDEDMERLKADANFTEYGEYIG
jgi:hypothetical protein